MKVKTIVISIWIIVMSCKAQHEQMETVKTLDLAKYAGTWYEIARLPNRFEKGLECVTAEYSLQENGKVQVINRGIAIDNPQKQSRVKGVAWVPDSREPGKLKVRFFWPFAGAYWVLAINNDYSLALVGSPSKKYLWILSKKKEVEDKFYDEFINLARRQGYDVSGIIMVKQHCHE